MVFHIRTLGGAALERDGAAVAAVAGQRKALALLSLLAAAGQHGMSRDRVAAYLWAESAIERSRGALSQTLHVLRRHFGHTDAILGPGELRLNPAHVDSDVGNFLAALQDNQLARAAELYAGPFLDGFHVSGAPEFDHWASEQRDHLARRHAWALERLAAEAERRGDHDAGVGWWRRLHAADPLSGRTTVRLMRALEAAGQRAMAIRAGQAHTAQLLEELGTGPDQEVEALTARLRGIASLPAATIPAVAPAPVPAPVPTPALRAPTMRELRPPGQGELPVHHEAPEPLAPSARQPEAHGARARAWVPYVVAAVLMAALTLAFMPLRENRTVRAGAGPAAQLLPTGDREAYDLYLRGRHSWRLRTREGLEQAVTFYQQAVERDPRFALAYSGMADAYVNLGNFGYTPLGETLARAEVAAARAIELDSTLAAGRASRGFALASQGAFATSESELRLAIALDPAYTWAHHFYSLLLQMLDEPAEALRHNAHALATDALSLPANANRGVILLQAGDYAAATRELERALELAPDFPVTLQYLGVALAGQGRDAEALPLLQRAARIAPEFPGVLAALAHVNARLGRPDEADSIMRVLEARAAEPRGRINLALAHAMLGRLDLAIPRLQGTEWDVPTLIELRTDPLLERLREDPRFRELLRQIVQRDGIGRSPLIDLMQR